MLTTLMLIQAAAASPTPAPWTALDRSVAGGAHAMSAAAPALDGGGRLVVRCDHAGDAVVSIQYIPATPFPIGGMQPVSLQFDGGTPMVANWERMGGGAIERLDGAVTTLTTALVKARRVRLHTSDGGGAAHDADFVGPASDTGVRAVLQACGYTLGSVPDRVAAAPAPAAAPAGEDTP